MGGMLGQGMALGAGSAVGHMAINSMMGGGGGGHQQQGQSQEYAQEGQGQYEEPGTNWALYGGLAAAAAGGAYMLTRKPAVARRAFFLPAFAAPVTTYTREERQ